MNDAKYIGLDVHQATISVAVLDSAGKLTMEAILETKAETILQFLRGLRGSLHVTLEEGTWAAWLHDLLRPHVTRVLVCEASRVRSANSFHLRSFHGKGEPVRIRPLLRRRRCYCKVGFTISVSIPQHAAVLVFSAATVGSPGISIGRPAPSGSPVRRSDPCWAKSAAACRAR